MKLSFILFMVAMCCLLYFCSCSKEKWEDQQRQQVHMMTDFYDSDTVLIDTREHFYTGVKDSVYWFSGSELMEFKNYKPVLTGCEKGFQRMRYEFNTTGKPFIYKH